jgi:hypothetical protein
VRAPALLLLALAFAASRERAPSTADLVAAPDGRWQVIRREFGYPAAMPRRMSLPLGRLPRATTALRMSTTQEIYRDRLAVGYAVALPEATATVLPLASAAWTRRFVLDARGWCKDMDLYTRDGDTVEPRPGVRSHAVELLQRRYTTRYESGR